MSRALVLGVAALLAAGVARGQSILVLQESLEQHYFAAEKQYKQARQALAEHRSPTVNVEACRASLNGYDETRQQLEAIFNRQPAEKAATLRALLAPFDKGAEMMRQWIGGGSHGSSVGPDSTPRDGPPDMQPQLTGGSGGSRSMTLAPGYELAFLPSPQEGQEYPAVREIKTDNISRIEPRLYALFLAERLGVESAGALAERETPLNPEEVRQVFDRLSQALGKARPEVAGQFAEEFPVLESRMLQAKLEQSAAESGDADEQALAASFGQLIGELAETRTAEYRSYVSELTQGLDPAQIEVGAQPVPFHEYDALKATERTLTRLAEQDKLDAYLPLARDVMQNSGRTWNLVTADPEVHQVQVDAGSLFANVGGDTLVLGDKVLDPETIEQIEPSNLPLDYGDFASQRATVQFNAAE